ncbi:hypothetical protein CFAM422_000454 [Trichoderma lentiforme]|uniref:Uncharacterized protein n=1 Tax=Trichoderma lentiforme TaxID=1567552 RepID=A0A9P5CG60_9HYPO|nr:hypothetical protein CFAM422_000454 [Trichoderma lentiforme]
MADILAPRLRPATTMIHDTRTKPGQAPSSSSSEFQTPAGQLSATTFSTADGLLLMLFFALRAVLRGEAVASCMMLDGFSVHVNQQHNAAEERTAFLRHPADTVLTKQAKPVWFRAAQD